MTVFSSTYISESSLLELVMYFEPHCNHTLNKVNTLRRHINNNEVNIPLMYETISQISKQVSILMYDLDKRHVLSRLEYEQMRKMMITAHMTLLHLNNEIDHLNLRSTSQNVTTKLKQFILKGYIYITTCK